MTRFTQQKVFAFFSLLLIPLALAAQPPVHWKFRIKQPIISSPVASDGVVYFGALDSTVYAVDIQNGSLKWKLRTNGEIRSNLVLHNNQLFLAGGNGVLSCIDKNSGKRVWSSVYDNTAVFLSERRYDFADYYHSSPLIHNNVIYLGSGDGTMRAMKAENGELIWSFKTGDIIHNTAVVVKDKLCFGSFDGYVYALNIKDGSLVWKLKSLGQQYFPRGEINTSPVAHGNTIIIGSRDFNSYAINVDGGHVNWNKVWQAWAPSYMVEDTVVYIGTSDDHVLTAIDIRNGSTLWKTNSKFNVFGGSAIAQNTLYVGTIWGRLLAIDPKNGNIRWVFNTDGHIANHDKYFKQDDTFRNDIASILHSPIEWIAAEYKMGGIWSTPLVIDDHVIFTTAEGTVYCLK